MISCILSATDIVNDHIRQHGDGPISQTGLTFELGGVVFGLAPVPAQPQPILTYSDTIAVMAAFSLKMSREGYRQWFASVDVTGGGEHLGDALITGVEDETV